MTLYPGAVIVKILTDPTLITPLIFYIFMKYFSLLVKFPVSMFFHPHFFILLIRKTHNWIEFSRKEPTLIFKKIEFRVISDHFELR